MIAWTERILDSHLLGSSDLPDTISARVAIDNRDLPREQLLAALLQPIPFASPFTAQYPRYTRDDAVATLRSLPERCIILDFESTGIKADSEITEIGLCALHDDTNTASCLVKPKALTSYSGSKAEKISGIKAARLKSAKPLPEIWLDLQHILGSYHIITYNADYDIRLLRASLQAWGILAPMMQATCGLKIATAYFERDYYLSLESACKLANVDQAQFGKAHEALSDALATRALLKKLMNEVAV